MKLFRKAADAHTMEARHSTDICLSPPELGEHYMADSENTPMGDATSESTPADAEALGLEETRTHEGAIPAPAPAPAEGAPLRDDHLLFFDGGLMRNELADAQADPEAARSLAARHWS